MSSPFSWPRSAPQERVVPLSAYCPVYRVEGEGGEGPPLVLLPGLAGGIRLVQPLAERLAEHFQVYSLELRGETDSFEIRRPFSAADLAEDVLEFCDALRLERPLLMGVSFGGAIALEFASRYSRRIAGLIVQGADIRFEPSLLRRVAGEILNGYPLPSDSPFVNQFFNLLFGFRPQDKALAQFVAETCWQTDQAVMARRFNLAAQMDLSGRLATIRVPTLVIRGGRDLFVSSRGTAQMVRDIPQAERIELPQAGHLAFLTHTREIHRLVVAFAQQYGLVDAVPSVNSCDFQA